MQGIQGIVENLETFKEIDYLRTFISFFCCVIVSFALKYVYEEKSSSLSGKYHVGSIIPLLSIVTFLVILIVKSSLALSLGLVGALSIVRFRTPIKEPEELVYLFLAIAIGLGYGAGQIIATSSISILILLIVWFLISRKNTSGTSDYNLVLECNELKKNKEKVSSSFIVENFKKIFDDIDLVKFEKTIDNKIVIVICVKLIETKQIDDLKNNLEKDLNDLKITFYLSNTIY
jgi:uncharacterized membrane protein YhiD involved in acid resistance